MEESRIRQFETKWSPKKRTKFSESLVEINTGKQNEENAAEISSLDQLPVEILESIIAYVPQADLLSFCLVSKYFYSFAIKKLYSKIMMFNSDYIHWMGTHPLPIENTINYATKLLIENRWNFLATVMTNNYIASLINSFTVEESEQMDEFPEISQYMSILLCHVHLENLYCLDSIPITTAYNLISIKSMTCHLIPHDGLYEDLSELKISYNTADFRHFSFDALARTLIDQNMHHKIRSFAIILGNSYNPEGGPNNTTPTWSKFFEVFVARGLKLNLTALGLNGEYWAPANEFTSEIICKAVEVRKLETLDINFADYLIASSSDYIDEEEAVEDSYGFLSALTKNMTSLSNLCITYDLKSKEAKLARLIRVLKKDIPNQLLSLRIHFEFARISEVELLQNAILSHQQNLVKLNLSFEPSHKLGVYSLPTPLQDLKGEVSISEEFAKRFSSDILETNWRRHFLEDDYMDVFKSHMEDIQDYLELDLIYAKAANYLPYLTEYVVLGIYIDMKSRRILNNGLVISLK